MRNQVSPLNSLFMWTQSRMVAPLAIGLFCASASLQASAEPDNLLSVVNETLMSNPEIGAKLEAFYASQHDARVIFGDYLPSVDASASLGRANRQYDSRDAYTRNYGEISLTQMLFDGFRVRNNLAKAEHTSRSLYYDALSEAETKALEASEAYLDVLRYREMVRLSQQNLGNHLRVQSNVADRAGSGVGNRADLQQIDGRVSLARSNLMTEVANLQTVTARFQRLVGRIPSDTMAAVTVNKDRIPANLEQVLLTSYTNNPALYSAFENIGSAESGLKAAKANRYPTFELGMRQGIYKNNNSFDSATDPDTYGSENIVELRMRYNLYNGGSDRAGERAAYQRINQAEHLRDKACVDLRQTATIAYTDIANIDIRLDSLAKHREASVNVIEAYRQQFDIGRRSLLDVLDSENESYQAERAYAAGQYDLQLAQLRTLQSMGQLLPALSSSSERLPTLADSLAGEAAPEGSYYCSTLGNAQMNIDQYTQVAPVQKTVGLSGDALFDVGSAVLKPGALGRLQNFTERELLQGGELKVVSVVGHTDNTGSAELNRKLSQDRAIAVRDFLISAGVTPGIISASGVGPAQPVATNATAAGRAENRRVDIHVERVQ